MNTKITFLAAGIVFEEAPQPLPKDSLPKMTVEEMLKAKTHNTVWKKGSPRILHTPAKIECELLNGVMEHQKHLLGCNQPIAFTFPDGLVMLLMGRGRIDTIYNNPIFKGMDKHYLTVYPSNFLHTEGVEFVPMVFKPETNLGE